MPADCSGHEDNPHFTAWYFFWINLSLCRKQGQGQGCIYSLREQEMQGDFALPSFFPPYEWSFCIGKGREDNALCPFCSRNITDLFQNNIHTNLSRAKWFFELYLFAIWARGRDISYFFHQAFWDCTTDFEKCHDLTSSAPSSTVVFQKHHHHFL